jgi:glutaredoxin 3
MNSAIVYTRKICSYCTQAKHLLNQLGVPFTEINIDGDPETARIMIEKSGRRTVPQIWIGETHVGGFDDLYSLHRSGKLQALLEGTNGETPVP